MNRITGILMSTICRPYLTWLIQLELQIGQ
ncbi:hypothetical protein BRADI_1g34122v3 [Brachypodium distachyon]|uniref:Uncharacterized protein n=1 Tax=Brachypodium distachyon TaxID=15368 RepID=A0A2K2DML7_BRADI|nr:hypothetical protein BRADI_1g34122v3 [Brachypodium distachyon]